MNTTIFDVASFILQEQGEMSTMKLQKLCYFSQGWSLAWAGEPLFEEDFQAWANGPVSRELYREHRGEYSVMALSKGNADNLTESQKLIVQAVLGSYAQMSGFQLSELTHKASPWRSVREKYNKREGERCEGILEKESIKSYFESV